MLNAQQAMPEGGTIFVSTRLSRGVDPEFLMSDSVQLQIRDTGKGIPEEHLPHIFEPFFSTKEEKGTGLGLWVSQGIVQAHGGSIKLRSREGRGTVFNVALPINGPIGACRTVVSSSSTTRRTSPSPWAPSSRWMVTMSPSAPRAPTPCGGCARKRSTWS